MMTRSKSGLTAILVVLLLSLGFGATAQEATTIKWFMRWDQNRVENVAMPVAEAFTEQTGINIEFENIGSGSDYYTKLQTTVAGGTPPDVFYPATHVANAYASKGALLTINEFVERDGIDLSVYDPTILANYQIDGELHCLPIDHAALGGLLQQGNL